MKPWEKSPLEIEVIDVYESEIIGETDDKYSIEFYDSQMEVVEAYIPKSEFEDFPCELKPGTPFGITIYKENGIIKIGAFPAEKYWNQELCQQ